MNYKLQYWQHIYNADVTLSRAQSKIFLYRMSLDRKESDLFQSSGGNVAYFPCSFNYKSLSDSQQSSL
jgi:hypothetical protein